MSLLRNLFGGGAIEREIAAINRSRVETANATDAELREALHRAVDLTGAVAVVAVAAKRVLGLELFDVQIRGASVQARDGKLTITSVTTESPAAAAGLRAGDEISQIDGAKASVKVLSDALIAKKPGDTLKLSGSREVEVTLGKNSKRTWSIKPAAATSEPEAASLKDWLRDDSPQRR